MDFYEEDEPIEDVLRAFAAGDEGVTAQPGGTAGRTYTTPSHVQYLRSQVQSRSSHRPLATRPEATQTATIPTNA